MPDPLVHSYINQRIHLSFEKKLELKFSFFSFRKEHHFCIAMLKIGRKSTSKIPQIVVVYIDILYISLFQYSLIRTSKGEDMGYRIWIFAELKF